MAHLDRWANGLGGEHEDRVDRWFERVKRQGFDGVRVFGETNYWVGGPFYPKLATVGPIWDWRALQAGHRPERVTIHNDKIIRKLVEKLKAHELIADYVVDATMKHSGISAETIGHCIRQTANYMMELEKELGSLNLWIEGHNEWRAHNQAGLNLWELNQQAIRFRRPEQWPGSIITVSESVGTNKYTYEVGGKHYDAVDIHPDRKGEWDALPRNWKQLTSQGVPCYFSETMHYMTHDQWDLWVPQIPKWAGMSTVQHDRVLLFMDRAINEGISFCVHDLTGQLTDPDQPWSPLEKELGDQGPPPPPPPPPPPEWKTVYEDDTTRLQKKDSNVDPPPPPPPPPDKSKDYLVLSRGRVLQADMEIRQQAMIWQGVRDPAYAATHCEQHLQDILGVSQSWLAEYAERGQALYDEGEAIRKKLGVEHPKYPGRSTVRKAIWKDFNTRYTQHDSMAEELRARAQRDPIRQQYAYDSIQGWCKTKNT
jgi:hypothetical protein